MWPMSLNNNLVAWINSGEPVDHPDISTDLSARSLTVPIRCTSS